MARPSRSWQAVARLLKPPPSSVSAIAKPIYQRLNPTWRDFCISADSYRDVQPLLKDGALEVEGERIEFAPENAARIRDAVAEARRQARGRRKPGSLDFLLDNLEKRVDQLIQDLRAIAPRAYNETRWRRFRGVLEFLCEQVAELRAEHRINEVSCQFQNITEQAGRRNDQIPR